MQGGLCLMCLPADIQADLACGADPCARQHMGTTLFRASDHLLRNASTIAAEKTVE